VNQVMELIGRIKQSTFNTICDPADACAIERMVELHLPDLHVELLSRANGMAIFHGYFRLFGVRCSGCRDMERWNDPGIWKFAWDDGVLRFLCFAETGLGHQFAYDVNELRGGGIPHVYRLSYMDMRFDRIWEDSFDSFVERDVMRWLADPYSLECVEALNRLGPITWAEHVAFAPPVVLGGPEDPAHIVKMPAVSNMIINGDLNTELDKVDEGLVQAVEPWVDDKGRMRMRIRWAEQS
jgi:hypothetical protein